MGKQKGRGGFAQHFNLIAMGLATMVSGAIPSTITGQAHSAPLTVQQAAQEKDKAPITNPIPIQARKQTAIGTAIPRRKRHTPRSIPQKHAKRHTNRIAASRKAKRKHRKAA